MIIRNPYDISSRYNDDPISFVDLAPTMLSIAGIEIPDYIQGRAFMGDKKNPVPREYIFGSGDRFDETYDRVRSVISKEFVYVRNYHKDRPAYKDVLYRKNIDMTNEMLKLYNDNKLNADQKYWYRQSKTEEEFYVRSTDPFSLRNIIDDPGYKNEIKKHRLALKKWQKEIQDIGALPEKKHLSYMWPEGIQPQTQKPKVVVKEGLLNIESLTLGSSSAYIISDLDFQPGLDDGWKLYHQPVVVDKSYLYVISTRLGFKDSDIVKIKL